MKKETVTTIGIALCILIAISVIIAFAFSVFGMPSFLKKNNEGSLQGRSRLKVSAPIIDTATIRKGPDTAVMKIVEYSDFLCPACSQATPMINELLALYPNDIQLVWKDFPVEQSHPGTTVVHNAARCAAEVGRFWDFHDQLFKQTVALNRQGAILLAHQLGLPVDRFQVCMDSGRYVGNIRQDISEGEALGVDATPYYIIGDVNISGLPEKEQLEQILRDLKKREQLR